MLITSIAVWYVIIIGPQKKIEFHPDEIYDDELWAELINKIENDSSNYDRFEKMNSNQAFGVMKDFAHSLDDDIFKENLLKSLSNRRPFQNFKNLIDYSEHRQDWFDFKKKAYIDWVKEQI